MNDEPRKKLHEIIVKYGSSICNDVQSCKGLLKDYCNGYPGETYALIAALEEQAMAELLNTSANIPQELLLSRLTDKLQKNRLMDKVAWKTLLVLLVGHIIFAIFALLSNTISLHGSLPTAWQALLSTEVGALLITVISAIVVRIINTARN